MTFENITHLYKLLVTESHNSICVFDLDSTLFNVSPRSEKILHEFAVENNLPELLKITVDLKDWGVYETLLRSGYDKDTHTDLHDKLKKVWRDRFFSNKYINYDEPYLGAVHFVQSLAKRNVQMYYLTGRDILRMGEGTASVLKKWGLPAEPEQIHLKPHKDMDDDQFKLNWLKKLSNENKNSKIYLFENEPVNINLVGQNIPHIRLIFMNTTHSRKQSVSVPHTEILNYVIERD
jgi:hypothetical protein